MENAQPLALVCIDNAEYNAYVQQTLQSLGFMVQGSTELEDSLVRIRVATYDVIVLFAEFGGKPLAENLIWRETLRLPIATRRKEYIVLISTMLPTRNELTEFVYSVELILNAADVANLPILVRQGVASRQANYALFHALSRPRALQK